VPIAQTVIVWVIQAQMDRAINLSHAACAKAGLDTVIAESLANKIGHVNPSIEP
jgi:hypothetical protein